MARNGAEDRSFDQNDCEFDKYQRRGDARATLHRKRSYLLFAVKLRTSRSTKHEDYPRVRRVQRGIDREGFLSIETTAGEISLGRGYETAFGNVRVRYASLDRPVELRLYSSGRITSDNVSTAERIGAATGEPSDICHYLPG